ncbi:hypothetical protein OSB04_027520 [Centaurea solstitialis]|uniref:Uncharacterized protein n=1 Tax=Centaurea solstitialis TaxID=347529 RepID=A0AA38SFG0_9ASTR|nr:hypothetical protein OSB04_027520 [Centaurea solstitialis]
MCGAAARKLDTSAAKRVFYPLPDTIEWLVFYCFNPTFDNHDCTRHFGTKETPVTNNESIRGGNNSKEFRN